jgi:hypothetical protein
MGVLGRVQGIAAGISGGMNGKPRAWDRDEELDLVRELDKEATVYRTQQIKKGTLRANKSNGAAGILNIWNRASTLIFNGSIAQIGTPGEDHAEQLIVNWANNIITTKVRQLRGATINLLVFSQTSVCSDCMENATTGAWQTVLRAATILPPSAVTINISLWQWGNPNAGQSQYIPVFP